MKINNEPIFYKKKIAKGKIFIYFLFIQIILTIIGFLVFFTSTVSPFDDAFKNEWNSNFIQNNNEYAKEIVNNYNVEISKTNNCTQQGFFENNNLLYFCNDQTIYIFRAETNISTFLEEKKGKLIEYLIYSFIFSIISLIILGFVNKTLFTKGSGINTLTIGVKELENVIAEIDEYIDNKGNRLEYRLPTLISLALSVIETDVDFFNRYGHKIKTLSNKAYTNNLYYVSDELHVLYKEMEKKYFIKKKKFIYAISSEASLLFTKYNTSLLGFIILIILITILSTYILMLLYNINGNNLSLINSFNSIINIFTLRNVNIETYNNYQNNYIVFLQILSYFFLLLSIKIMSIKR